jgi:ketosteroid isomerase-like protein
MSTEENKAQDNARLIQTLLDAVKANDFDPYLANVTADSETLDCASGETFCGPEGFRQWAQSYNNACPDARTLHVTSLFTTEDQGHLEYIARGTNTGPFPFPSGPIPPTGQRIEVRVCAGFQFREGKVASAHFYYDLLGLLHQLGLVPTPEGRLVPIS